MVSRSCGPWVTTFSILSLFIQGIYGKSLFEHMLDDGGEPSTTPRNPLFAGNYSSLNESLWDEMVKKPWFRTTIKNPPFLESDVHHDERKNISLNTTSLIARENKGFLGDTWNDRIKNILVSITGLIPPIEGIPVGKIISLLLKAFWPDSKKDVWSLIKDQVEGLIDQKILEYELQERNNEIKALQKTMQMYVEAQNKEKGALMSAMIQACNELFFKLTESKNSVQLIPVVVTHSTQHLLILKERLLHGKEMYNEDNTPIWRKDLEEQISSYKEYMKNIYTKWSEWRNSKITLDVATHAWEPYGIVYDEITKDRVKYVSYSWGDKNYFRPICESLKKEWFSFRNGELLQTMVTIFFLDNFMPGNEDNPSVIPPYMSTASFGPIAPYVGDPSAWKYMTTPGDDNTMGGDVTQMNVREWNIIDGIQIFYTTQRGSFIGNPYSGQLHEFPLNNKRIRSIHLCENNCNIVEMTIGFSNGESTGRLGNRGGWQVRCLNTGGIDNYGLYNIRASGRGCAVGLYQIELDYKAYSFRPSQIDNQALHLVDLAQEKFQYASVIDEEKIQRNN